MKKIISFSILLFVLSFFCSVKSVIGADTTSIKSPDGAIFFKLFQQGNDLAYTITFNGKAIIEPSLFSMTVDGNAVTKNTTADKTDRFSFNKTYEWRGAHSTALNQYNDAKIILNKNGDAIEIRVFKDAAAFRFIIPGKRKYKSYS